MINLDNPLIINLIYSDISFYPGHISSKGHPIPHPINHPYIADAFFSNSDIRHSTLNLSLLFYPITFWTSPKDISHSDYVLFPHLLTHFILQGVSYPLRFVDFLLCQLYLYFGTKPWGFQICSFPSPFLTSFTLIWLKHFQQGFPHFN